MNRSSLTRSAAGTSPVKMYLLFSATLALANSLSAILSSKIRKGVSYVISFCSSSPLSQPLSCECGTAGAWICTALTARGSAGTMGTLLAKLHIKVVTVSSSAGQSSFNSCMVPKKPLVESTRRMMFRTAGGVRGKVLLPASSSSPEKGQL